MFPLTFIFISKFQTSIEAYTTEFLSLLIFGIQRIDKNVTAAISFFVNNYQICTIHIHRG